VKAEKPLGAYESMQKSVARLREFKETGEVEAWIYSEK
jgi:hypothetical protein